ncbi:MAG: molecular chaperone HtpG [Clostridiales bacterium]|jgi:molecular chaperone HtpG|nr:molecular chaperone HtpG [Clostridiales bacterium]
MEKGNLSINSENILPIIKKWLYSDADIFMRELVSNGADAVTKLRKMSDMGEAPGVPKDERYTILVTLDKANKTISVDDNGIGMTGDEVKQYINQIAFSGANDFLEKYKDKIGSDADIIGHFGLGFYSAFMVADKVQIDTLSYAEGAAPVRWVCDGGVEYEMSESPRSARGTCVTLHINEESKDFLEEYKLRGVLNKYCGFIPVEIFFEAVEEKPKKPERSDDVIDAEAEDEAPKPINDINPLWLKQPSDCTDEEYKEFYHKVFMDFGDPLFWIHLNMDYPFRLKGILYFPKLKHELESIEGQVKLYNNQVFIADNIKEVIPEFLLLLKGALDCPDLPLNVSRSFLQNDGYVTKMSGYITRKVADKLTTLFKKDRDAYNGYWEDINQFIKYGCIRDKDFYDKVKPALLFKTLDGSYKTLEEFTAANKPKTGDKVYYVTNQQQQSQYIKLFKDNGMDAVVLSTNLDNPFISYLESYERDIHFNRIDSDLTDSLKDGGKKPEDESAANALQEIFKEMLDNQNLKVQTETLKSDSVSAIILEAEHSRRMQEMSKMFGPQMGLPETFASEETLVLNLASPLARQLLEMRGDDSRKEDMRLICQQIYDLAVMSHKPLDTEAMAKFIERSNKLLLRL